MFGAIAGDVIGSVFEANPATREDFDLFEPGSVFTDDTVMTVATAYALLHGTDYAATYKKFGRRCPAAGYGGMFFDWLHSANSAPYNSCGNGSAMRVSPVGFAMTSVEATLAEAKRSAEVTHNHPEGIKGAQAVTLAIFLGRQGLDKAAIKQELVQRFGYNLDRTLADIAPRYTFNETCQKSVPESIIAFLESRDYEDAVRKAILLGGDADTMACIAGGIAEAYYGGVPELIIAETHRRLPAEYLSIIDEFAARF